MSKILLFLFVVVNLSLFAALLYLYREPVVPECISPAQERRLPDSPVLQPSPPRFWAL